MHAGQENFVELPGSEESGQLACYTPPAAIQPSRFIWVAGPGLYRGALDLTHEGEQAAELDYLTDRSLLPLPLSATVSEDIIAVVSCCV